MSPISHATSSLAVLGMLGTVAYANPAGPTTDAAFNAFLAGFERGISAFLNGDPEQWLDDASRRDDVTIMGAWGAHEKGWRAAGPRYAWAAERFSESGAEVEVEYLASGVSGDLAYTVAIERSSVKLTGAAKTAEMALRVTHLFRKENGRWTMIHRHADPLIAKTAPDAVLRD